MLKFNRFLQIEDFTCDKCQRKFQWESAYSLASDWEEFKKYYTYCLSCAEIIEKKENQPKKVDKRTLNKTGRTHQLGTRVRKEFLKKLKSIARKEKLKYVEVLERALDCYDKKSSKKNPRKTTPQQLYLAAFSNQKPPK